MVTTANQQTLTVRDFDQFFTYNGKLTSSGRTVQSKFLKRAGYRTDLTEQQKQQVLRKAYERAQAKEVLKQQGINEQALETRDTSAKDRLRTARMKGNIPRPSERIQQQVIQQRNSISTPRPQTNTSQKQSRVLKPRIQRVDTGEIVQQGDVSPSVPRYQPTIVRTQPQKTGFQRRVEAQQARQIRSEAQIRDIDIYVDKKLRIDPKNRSASSKLKRAASFAVKTVSTVPISAGLSITAGSEKLFLATQGSIINPKDTAKEVFVNAPSEAGRQVSRQLAFRDPTTGQRNFESILTGATIYAFPAAPAAASTVRYARTGLPSKPSFITGQAINKASRATKRISKEVQAINKPQTYSTRTVSVRPEGVVGDVFIPQLAPKAPALNKAQANAGVPAAYAIETTSFPNSPSKTATAKSGAGTKTLYQTRLGYGGADEIIAYQKQVSKQTMQENIAFQDSLYRARYDPRQTRLNKAYNEIGVRTESGKIVQKEVPPSIINQRYNNARVRKGYQYELTDFQKPTTKASTNTQLRGTGLLESKKGSVNPLQSYNPKRAFRNPNKKVRFFNPNEFRIAKPAKPKVARAPKANVRASRMPVIEGFAISTAYEQSPTSTPASLPKQNRAPQILFDPTVTPASVQAQRQVPIQEQSLSSASKTRSNNRVFTDGTGNSIPKSIPPTPSITSKTAVIPPVINFDLGGGLGGGNRSNRKGSRAKASYSPSITGILIGKKEKTKRKTGFTGLEVRGF